MSPSIADVRAAATGIAGSVQHTPFVPSRVLSEITGADVWLKLESLQFTASFKERGALWRLLALDAGERARGVVTMSAGNFAQAVAWHASQLGISSVIVMPRATPYSKIEQTERLGATVRLAGDDLSAAEDEARRVADTERRSYLPPYDDDRVIAGQGTVALEILEAASSLDAVVVPTGGGGLLAGVALVTRELRPSVAVVGVQVDSHPFFAEAFGARVSSEVPRGAPTIAEGITAKRPGARTLALARGRVDDVLLVGEDAIEESVRLFAEIEKLVVEGAGASGLAALLVHRERFAGKRVAVIVSGGNIDARVLSLVLLRGLVRDGRLARLRVVLPDRPGALARLASLLGDAGANILEIVHQRAFAHAPLREAEVEISVETRSRAHVQEVVAALGEAGMHALEIDGPATRAAREAAPKEDGS